MLFPERFMMGLESMERLTGEWTHQESRRAPGMHSYRDPLEFLPGACHLLTPQTDSAQLFTGVLHAAAAAAAALSWGTCPLPVDEESKTKGDDVLGTRGVSFSS